jgi:hypothetical protein
MVAGSNPVPRSRFEVQHGGSLLASAVGPDAIGVIKMRG